jgi:hypothetical protein
LGIANTASKTYSEPLLQAELLDDMCPDDPSTDPIAAIIRERLRLAARRERKTTNIENVEFNQI